MSLTDTAPTLARSVADMLVAQIPGIARLGPGMARIDVEPRDAPSEQNGGQVLVLRVRPCNFREAQLEIVLNLTIRSIAVADDDTKAIEAPASDP